MGILNKFKFNSIKFEISILYTLILGVILIVFSGILSLMSNSFFKGIDSELKGKARQIEQTVNSYLTALAGDPKAMALAVEKTITMKPEGLFQVKTKAISRIWADKADTMNLTKDYINFVDKDGRSIVSSKNLDAELQKTFMEDIQFVQGKRVLYRTVSYKKTSIRMINYIFRAHNGDRYTLQVGMLQDPLMRLMLNWLYSILISVPLILLLTSFVGKVLASRILKPVHEITSAARNITHHDLSARIQPKHFDVEMADLAEAFNDMISRLERSFKHIEEFSYHVAHELKTPLTIIRGEAELVLRKERTPEEYKKALRITLEESERMLKTVEDLLLLTKLDYQPDAFKFEHFDFHEFLLAVCSQGKVLALKKNILLDCEISQTKVMINGAQLHLRRLFFNIIDNAVKFTPEGGRIHITLTYLPKMVIVAIADTGPGIPQEDLPKIFNRFFSIDNTEGNGLGLNIAQTIAKLHKGNIFVESRFGSGATFKIVLPQL